MVWKEIVVSGDSTDIRDSKGYYVATIYPKERKLLVFPNSHWKVEKAKFTNP